MKSTTKSLIIAISSVAVLAGAFSAVYFLLPSQEEAEKNSSDAVSSEEADHYHLISHVPADIKKIDVENETGKYTILSDTPKTESTAKDGTVSTITDSTVYTLVGYEDMKLLDGSPDTLADDAASVTAEKIVNDGSKKSDFGFDSPRAVVKVTYQDNEQKTITLGSDAPDNKGAYIMIEGDSNVYLTDSDSVDGYLIGAMGMLSTEIGKAAADDDSNKFTKMVFSGSLFDNKDVVFGYNTSEAYSETYVITSPDKTIANEEAVTYMMSNIREFSANEVIAVNADEAKIKEYGLDDPYVTVSAQYPDLKVDYKATKPDANGEFYLLSDNIIYKTDKNTVSWVNYTYDQLIPEDVIAPKADSVDKITVEFGKDIYIFDITRNREVYYDTDKDTDVDNTTLSVKCNEKDISEACYNAFYQNLTSAKRSGITNVDSGKETLLKVTFQFSDNTTATAEYFKGENRKCPVLINGTIGSTAYESYVTKIIDDTAKAANNEVVKSIY
ncbi:MAG: DUF4340 domain-containing protein [Clostridia bacterium]|nr:DUF4340 domain-containing protein [Clostridia bacterium]